ncbi:MULTISPECIES: hypothetical protein [Staphylococcus]|jgi:hypothetical protein|uniref:hypothetical protein n=1 Tax=Staphylococcus TaxID=1279 RepID=UPI000FF88104|nr:hypothetical protein [Staphylococcus saprophyticus]CAC7532261.1 Uncharacterised protein [Staphylococcus aureus]MBC2921945.1 hypothetical protein [Staphylococcus saprophyticus]MBC2958532.1 hypothetical protein [Staphylococcus saprophyticus]MBC3010385.1 hypothetical protein [Staphylococcus saprophyticus]MBC3024264.1 hypothetical protein [Staphylococcus saprophyticus]
MNETLKEKIIFKVKTETGIAIYNWQAHHFETIENLFSTKNIIDKYDEDEWLSKLRFDFDKLEFLEEMYSDNITTKQTLLEHFVDAGTVNDFINLTLDGYGIVLDNEVIISRIEV